MDETTVGFDETGIWREDRPGYRTRLPWSEITRVAAYKLDCVTSVVTVIEFDHESGHFVEINSDWTGFDSVVEATGKHYSLPADWYAAAENRGAHDDAIIVWQRADYPTC